jgi:hypothetical protein
MTRRGFAWWPPPPLEHGAGLAGAKISDDLRWRLAEQTLRCWKREEEARRSASSPAADQAGEVLSLRREDLTARPSRSAAPPTRPDPRGDEDRSRRTRRRAASSPSLQPSPWRLEAQINLNGSGCELLFPTLRGRLWRERTFYRDPRVISCSSPSKVRANRFSGFHAPTTDKGSWSFVLAISKVGL